MLCLGTTVFENGRKTLLCCVGISLSMSHLQHKTVVKLKYNDSCFVDLLQYCSVVNKNSVYRRHENYLHFRG